MDLENLELKIEDQVAIITINRPAKLNALNKATLLEIKCSLQQVNQDDKIKALIITGKGEKAFAAGADIPEIAGLDAANSKEFSENGQEIFNLIEGFPKPVIAAINGFALGGGCELALACHLRIASENAKLGLPEASLGILPAFGGTQRLTRLIGKGRALELMLTGKMITATEAANIGMINKVVKNQSDLMPDCLQMTADIIKNAPLSLRKIIIAANSAFRKDGYNIESHCFADLIESDDFVEGTQAFMEKRSPRFKGS